MRNRRERIGFEMKKRWMMGALCTMLAATLVGCGSGKLSNKYITIEKYEGLEVEAVEPEEVTDETVDYYISGMLSYSQIREEITDRAVQEGDTVNIDYSGSFDGEVFPGGTDTGSDLVIGSGSFIGATEEYAGFEEQIVGHWAGEEFDITVQFPTPYKPNPDYAGKVAVFHIKLNGIYQMSMPELTDEWVVQNGNGAQTVEEYREQVREGLTEDTAYRAHQDTVNAVFNALLPNITVKSYPEGEVEAQAELVQSQYQTYAQAYGVDLATFVENYAGMTEAEFAKQTQTSAENYVKVKLACELIAEEHELESTGDEYEKDVEELARTIGYDDVEQFKQTYDADMIKNTILQEKVAAYLLEKSAKPGENAAEDTEKE